MRRLTLLAVFLVMTRAAFAAPDQRAEHLLGTVPAKPAPLMFRDLIRQHDWRVETLISTDADEGNIHDEGYRKGDIFLDVYFANDSFRLGEPCGFGASGMAPTANFLFRQGHWIAESPLASWVLTGRCPR